MTAMEGEARGAAHGHIPSARGGWTAYDRGMRRLALVFAAAVAAACGDSGDGPADPGPPVLSVGGTYQVTPTVLQNPCGPVEVLPGPATVAHFPGATSFAVSHAGQTYNGIVLSGGAFSTTPRVIALGDGSTDTVTLGGRFTTNGFDATVTVDTSRPGAPPCTYTVRWSAAKQGPPNTFS